MAIGVLGYVLPYFAPTVWWRFSVGTAVIIAAGSYLYGGQALRFFGLRMTLPAFVTSLALCLIAIPLLSYILADFVGSYLDVDRYQTLEAHVHQLFQVLNDELVMRAALLTLVLGVMPCPRTAVLATACAFAIAHALFYARGGPGIDALALLTLFAFGVVGNTLFVAFGHIGYSVALHYAWNFYRFGAWYRLDGRLLSQGETFNYIEGNPWIAGASTVLMLAVFGAYSAWGRSALLDTPHREQPEGE